MCLIKVLLNYFLSLFLLWLLSAGLANLPVPDSPLPTIPSLLPFYSSLGVCGFLFLPFYVISLSSFAFYIGPVLGLLALFGLVVAFCHFTLLSDQSCQIQQKKQYCYPELKFNSVSCPLPVTRALSVLTVVQLIMKWGKTYICSLKKMNVRIQSKALSSNSNIPTKFPSSMELFILSLSLTSSVNHQHIPCQTYLRNGRFNSILFISVQPSPLSCWALYYFSNPSSCFLQPELRQCQRASLFHSPSHPFSTPATQF